MRGGFRNFCLCLSGLADQGKQARCVTDRCASCSQQPKNDPDKTASWCLSHRQLRQLAIIIFVRTLSACEATTIPK